MRDATDLRATLFFGVLGALGLALVARLAWLQLVRAPFNAREVERQRAREELLAAPRGTIVDRDGRCLAFDRPVMEVRAEAYASLAAGREAESFAEFALDLAADLASALAADPALGDQRDVLRGRIERCRPGAAGGASPPRRHKVDFLVHPAIESAAVLWRLRQMDDHRSWLHLHFALQQRRTYPDREATVGPVGFVGERDLGGGASLRVYRGMEAFAGLGEGDGGERTSWRDATARRYWAASSRAPETPAVLQSTLDLELQRAASEELAAAVAQVTAAYGSPPEWGALCLAELATGDLLAMASHREGVDPKVAAFAPIQCLCPPGSVVKPLLFAVALERGVLDWHGPRIDCRAGPEGWKVPGVARRIKDSHSCGELTPRDILVQSSNIGAVKVGRRLGRDGILAYLEQFRFGVSTGTRLPGEQAGVVDPGPARLATMPERGFEGYAGPSLSFGYGCNLPPLQILRVYVSLLSGCPRELRLYRRIATASGIEELPPAPLGPRLWSEGTVALLVDAMRGVVSEEPDATGRHLAEELARLGQPGAVAGKTGTSEYGEVRDRRRVIVRTASFAGFAPPERPRYVVLCVLQKPEADHFWGGRYAAPAAGRLLLRALSEPPSRRPANPQVSVGSPEGAGLPARQW